MCEAIPLKYVGIDPSYSGFGITILDEDGSHETHVWDFSARTCKGSGSNQLYAVYRKLAEYLVFAAEPEQYAHVGLEGYAFNAKRGVAKSGELGGVVKVVLMLVMPMPVCYPTIIAPPQVKRYASGEGDAAKDNMLLYVYKQWGVEFDHIPPRLRNNAADSYAIARMVMDLEGGTAEHQYQRDVIAKLKPHTEGGAAYEDWLKDLSA